MAIVDKVEAWVAKAIVKLKDGGITGHDLEELSQTVHSSRKTPRQRLLYLHAASPSIRSEIIATALHEPVPDSITEITTEEHEWPYQTVHEAILNGWQVIHFPDQRAPFDDREIDILGYEFILQKLEEYNE